MGRGDDRGGLPLLGGDGVGLCAFRLRPLIGPDRGFCEGLIRPLELAPHILSALNGAEDRIPTVVTEYAGRGMNVQG